MNYNINVEIKVEFGWSSFLDGDYELFFKGYLYNCKINVLFDRLKGLNIDNIGEFVKNLDGQFAFVFKGCAFTVICSDKIRSVPLFYIKKDKDIYISNNANSLVNLSKYSFEDINQEQLLCFSMSGYTLGDSTLYKGLLSLKAGEVVVLEKFHVKKYVYYRYEPWNVIQKDYESYKDELLRVTLNIFNKMISNLDGRQVVIPLSAGNDSRLIASALKHLDYKNVLCYSYGTKGNFESKVANIVSDALGYKFVFIPMTYTSEKKYYKSAEYRNFLQFSDSYSSIQFLQSVSTIKYLKENELIDKDAVFINGNSGDFISGGHILGKVQDDNSALDGPERLEIILNQIVKKHFGLWGYLQTRNNISLIKDMFKKELKHENITLDSIHQNHGVYEYLEFINRQSKYVIAGQRVYEFYGYEWRLPLWDDEYLNFWEKVPKEYKINQKLYTDMLNLSDFGHVWSEEIPINKSTIVPKWVIPMRSVCKIPFFFFGLRGRRYWHQFEISFFQYWMDNTHISNAINYKDMVKSFSRKPRNALSLIVENYIKELKTKEFNSNKFSVK
jgi:asparagine synthase (glutamine-hydrolysing)